MNKILGGEENCDREDIPSYLTPDADRGVTYSDEIIEMKVRWYNEIEQNRINLIVNKIIQSFDL